MDKEIMNLIPPIIGLGNDWTPFEQEMKKRFEGSDKQKYSLLVSVIIPVYNRRKV